MRLTFLLILFALVSCRETDLNKELLFDVPAFFEGEINQVKQNFSSLNKSFLYDNKTDSQVMIKFNAEKELNDLPSYRHTPPSTVPHHRFPSLSSAMLITWLFASPSVVEKFVNAFPLYRLTPPPSVPNQRFPDLSSQMDKTELFAKP